MIFEKYDIIVVGAGHAGSEAAHAAGKLGSKVLLITMNMEVIAKMSCNPAMGGVAKGQIVREIDALGGMSGIITDNTMIQFRMLNRSKGAAMWSPRAQSDRMRFSEEWRLALEHNPNVDFFQDSVTEILVENNKVIGVKTQMGQTIHTKSVIVTSGTFLNGKIHIGRKSYGGGRMGEKASTGITASLENFGFESGRMKTGTPPRLDGRTINYAVMEEQKGDENPGKFSFSDVTKPLTHQKSCFITYTNETVHEILREGFADSPMFAGDIHGIGPRYCPSIEDKINRFAERNRHQIFVEPEGWNTIEVYVNGFSSSLPEAIQQRALQQIKGFENVKMFRPGYAIEYDYFPPTQLKLSLETKLIDNLYFAGQINGTTGYEEAACQGLMAGINAHQKLKENDPLILDRSEAYIGVLIDDLINKGTEEPYRMFTSRAEYRILLRQDNADIRLTPLGRKIGLAEESRENRLEQKLKNIGELTHELDSQNFTPDDINPVLEKLGTPLVEQKIKASKILLRPQVSMQDLKQVESLNKVISSMPEDDITQTEISIKYASYIAKEKETADKIKRLENVKLNPDFDYGKIVSLSSESRQKLSKIRPETLGQASRISGVSPADISVLLVYFGR
ncbi:MAG: tRNA uridine-5-carboxymethylaminomethyl(34) synthesis enzyme MnmG [Bacteroidia bacterium]|nr:tRNA uridine-5-carboxymethylaminomethyl(34) synthesis enzyme MnmG [Bacteroidia bacterium]MCO5254483.1 tRNA uridine-5-carboxymethylaminomethyl(34) synthesis enzyme MnmG [Bacteroidota bacterium]